MGVRKLDGKSRIDYYNADGRRVRKILRVPKREAEKILGEVLHRKVFETYFGRKPEPADIGFDEMAERYMEMSRAEKRSWSRDQLSLKHLRRHFSGKKLSGITPLLVQRYKQERLQKVSPRTVNIELSCLRHLVNKAKLLGFFGGANPVGAGGVKLFKVSDGRLRYLLEDEITRLIEASEEYLRPVLVAAIWTGLRRSELLGLRWSDVDLANAIIHVVGTKNGQRREVPMSPHLRKVFNDLFRKRRAAGLEWVFTTSDGEKPLRDVRKPFFKALRRAGIADCRLHDLRHTFGSHLAMKGVDIRTVQELMGHRTIQMTMRYLHLSPAHKKEAVGVLDVFAAAKSRQDLGIVGENAGPGKRQFR